MILRGLLSNINTLNSPKIENFIDDKIIPISSFQIGIDGQIDSGMLQHKVNFFGYSPTGR